MPTLLIGLTLSVNSSIISLSIAVNGVSPDSNLPPGNSHLFANSSPSLRLAIKNESSFSINAAATSITGRYNIWAIQSLTMS